MYKLIIFIKLKVAKNLNAKQSTYSNDDLNNTIAINMRKINKEHLKSIKNRTIDSRPYKTSYWANNWYNYRSLY